MQKLKVFPFKKGSNMADNYQDVEDMQGWHKRLSVDMEERLQNLGLQVNLPEREQYLDSPHQGDLQLIIVGAQKSLTFNIPRNAHLRNIHFGRESNADVSFMQSDKNFKCSSHDELIKQSLHGYTSNKHSCLQVDMSTPSHPVLTLFDYVQDERKKTKVYNSAGEKSSLLGGGIVVESNDVIHFMPVYPANFKNDSDKFGNDTPNYEFGFLVLLWDPKFDLQCRKRARQSKESDEACPFGTNIMLSPFGNNTNPILVCEDEDKLVLQLASNTHKSLTTRIRDGAQALTFTTCRSFNDGFTRVHFELEDCFEATNTTTMRQSSTIVYTGAGIVVAQLNAEKRSTKLFVGDCMCFHNAVLDAVYELHETGIFP